VLGPLLSGSDAIAQGPLLRFFARCTLPHRRSRSSTSACVGQTMFRLRGLATGASDATRIGPWLSQRASTVNKASRGTSTRPDPCLIECLIDFITPGPRVHAPDLGVRVLRSRFRRGRGHGCVSGTST
jgi:hypothetical protein